MRWRAGAWEIPEGEKVDEEGAHYRHYRTGRVLLGRATPQPT